MSFICVRHSLEKMSETCSVTRDGGAKVLRNAGLWRRCEFMTAIWEIKLCRHDVRDFLNVASLSCPSQTPPHLNEARRLVVRYILDAMPVWKINIFACFKYLIEPAQSNKLKEDAGISRGLIRK